jgi:hypothetical protein
MRIVGVVAGVSCLVACNGSGAAPSPASDPPIGSNSCQIDVSKLPQGAMDSGSSRCSAPDGAFERCRCLLPDGGVVGVCGEGGQCIVGPIVTPGGPTGDWVCTYNMGGDELNISSLCSRSCGRLTVYQAVYVSDAILCTGDCVEESDAATAQWACVGQLGVSGGSSAGD